MMGLDEADGIIGGSLGWKAKGSLHPKFEEVAYALETSTTGNPKIGEAKTDFGYHIIMVSRISLLKLTCVYAASNFISRLKEESRDELCREFNASRRMRINLRSVTCHMHITSSGRMILMMPKFFIFLFNAIWP
jgi:hypothetical protein